MRNRYKPAIPSRPGPSRNNVEGSGTAVVVTTSVAVGENVPKVRLLVTLPEKDKNVPASVGVRENMKKSPGNAVVTRSGAFPESNRASPIRVVVGVI